jgi:hypothetical protein
MTRIRIVAAATLVLALAGPISRASARDASFPAPVPCGGCYAPPLDVVWQWQLQGTVDTSVTADLFDVDGFENTKAFVKRLHDHGDAAICYISAGSWESFRPDASAFPESVKGASNGWPGERWLDIRRLRILRPIMDARIQMCADKGFDAIEFDTVDGYQNHTGFPLTAADQARYNVFLANRAHGLGLSAVLKNDLGQVRLLLPYFDFALNEQCFQYRECSKLTPFVAAGKAVLGVEYKTDPAVFCPKAAALGFSFMKKKLSLRAWRELCP